MPSTPRREPGNPFGALLDGMRPDEFARCLLPELLREQARVQTLSTVAKVRLGTDAVGAIYSAEDTGAADDIDSEAYLAVLSTIAY